MVKILSLVIIMGAWELACAAETIQIRMGDGIHLEDNNAILYENTVPLIYELRWGDLKEERQEQSDVKWAHCYQNTTCTLRKILQDYKNNLAVQLNNLEPQTLSQFNTKQKRFSIMGWILETCCGVATQDEFNSLYKSEDLLASHMELIKNTVHADHRSLTEVASNADAMTKEFNGLIDKTKHTISDMMVEELNIEETEEIIIRHLMSIYKIANNLALKMRKNIASSSCQNKRIPSTIIAPNLLKLDLVNLTSKLLAKEWELAIPANMIGKYYGIPIAACIMTPNAIVVRVKVPIRRANKGWNGVNVIPIPIGDFNATCRFALPSLRAIKSEKLGRIAWITSDVHCQPEVTQLCLIPRGIASVKLPQLSNLYPATCVAGSSTLLTHLGNERFAITNPPASIQIHCGTNTEVQFMKLPGVVHGHIEILVPCDCLAIISEDLMIEKTFPCDSHWANNISLYHILPFNWTLKSEADISWTLKHQEMTNRDKLDSLLKPGWEFRLKSPVKVTEELQMEEPSTYSRVKSTVQEFHLEWTTVLSLFILVVLFREPLNLLLIRMVSGTPREGLQRTPQN